MTWMTAAKRWRWLAVAVAASPAVCWAQDAGGPQYGGYQNALDQFFVSGGIIVWFVLFPMSVAMLGLAINYLISIRRGSLMPPEVRQHIQEMLEQRQYREALEFTAAESSMLSYAIHTALGAAGGGVAAMQRALDDAIDERVAKLLRRIEILNIIGNIAPMIGLFGTIYGLILAFNQLVLERGTPEPAQLAGAISVAMVTTFWGLLAAIPALSFFAWFRNRIDGVAAECALVGEDLLNLIQPGAKGQQPAAGGKQPAAQAPRPAPAAAGGPPPVARRVDGEDTSASPG